MTQPAEDIAIEESKLDTRTTRFANWLMEREERRQDKESNHEGLVRLNVLVSFLTHGSVSYTHLTLPTIYSV